MPYTYYIIALTAIISLIGFSNQELYNRLILYPNKMKGSVTEYYRFLTVGLLHADMGHLFFNMFTLYFFGRMVEMYIGGPLFILLYLSALVASSLSTYIKHRDNPSYRSLGASGAVTAVLFASIYIAPWAKIYIFFIPIGIPSIVFAVLYLFYTYYMGKRGQSGINHDAHLWGSLYGLAFMLLADPSHGASFIKELQDFRY